MARMTSSALEEIIAVLGAPAAGNPAQYLFERAFQAAGLEWQIITCDVVPERIAEAVAGAAAMGFRGCLLAGPLRKAVLPLTASASPTAQFAGGVGLLERAGEGFTGHMTDGRGVIEALRAHIDPSGKNLLVLGAGLTARAVALELALAGVERIAVAALQADLAVKLVDDLARIHSRPVELVPWSEQILVAADVGIVVRATDANVPLDDLRGEIVFADLDPEAGAPPEATAANCCFVDGQEIRAVQAAIDFQSLTGLTTDPDMLREALDEFLS
jgi:shikimate dehydrogenase